MCFEIYSLLVVPFLPHTPWQKTEPKRTMKDRKHYGTLTAINMPPSNLDPRGTVAFIFQSGWRLEDYVEEFLDACHLAHCDEVCLMEGFRYGLGDDIRFVMPHGDPCWTIRVTSTSHCGGSAFTVDEADVEDHISVQPQRADFSQRLLLRSSSQVLSPLSPVIPSANPQPAITYLGSHQVFQSQAPIRREDPLSLPPATGSLTPPRPCEPLSPPWLLAPSSPPWSIIPPSLWLHLGQSLTIRRLRTTLLWLHLIPPSLRLCQAPPSLWLHLRPQSLRLHRVIPELRLRLGPPDPLCCPGSVSAQLRLGLHFRHHHAFHLPSAVPNHDRDRSIFQYQTMCNSSVELGLVYKTFVNKHTNETPTSECNLAGGNQ